MAIKKCLIKSNTPQDFSAALSIGGLMIQGSEPANTKRRIVFLVNGAWYKLANNNGTASLAKVPTQNITADSVLNEGNTVAELNALKSVPPFVGRYVYPAVAMWAADGVTTMPSIRLGFNYTENLNIGKPIGICIDHMGDPANGFKQVTVNGNLLTQEYLDSSAPPDNANAVIAYGVVLNQPGNTYGDWRRIDVDGNDLKITDFSKVWPYNEIKTVTVDGQQMVRIPKIYVNNTKLTKGPYAGKYQYSIANEKIDSSWHVHPAFMDHGKESNAILIGTHLASKDSSGKAASINGAAPWVSVTRDTAHSLGTNRNVPNGNGDKTGWHCYSIYDHHLIARLMLIEFGTADIPTKLTGRDNGMGATYRGINDVYGAVYNNRNTGEWLDGIDCHGKNNATRIFKNDGSQIYIDTGIASCGDGYVKDTLHNIGAGYDFGDIFLASVIDRTKPNGIFGDKQFTRGAEMNCGFNNFEDPGPFYLDYTPSGGADKTLGFRLAKYA